MREPDEFAAGHVPGAVNVPRHAGVLIADLQPDGTRLCWVYCKTKAARRCLVVTGQPGLYPAAFGGGQV